MAAKEKIIFLAFICFGFVLGCSSSDLPNQTLTQKSAADDKDPANPKLPKIEDLFQTCSFPHSIVLTNGTRLLSSDLFSSEIKFDSGSWVTSKGDDLLWNFSRLNAVFSQDEKKNWNLSISFSAPKSLTLLSTGRESSDICEGFSFEAARGTLVNTETPEYLDLKASGDQRLIIYRRCDGKLMIPKPEQTAFLVFSANYHYPVPNGYSGPLFQVPLKLLLTSHCE